MKPEKLRIVLALFIAGLIGYGIGVSKIALDWKNFQPHLEITSKEPPPSLMQADFSQFWLVLNKIETSYYDKEAINSQKIIDGAISGMIGSLNDPYTVYLPPKQNDDFKQGMAGQYGGIGAELGMKDKQIIIVAPLDGSPAQKLGLKAGDAILKVNDESTAGWSLNQTVEKIRGPKGTDVLLSIAHKGATEPQDVNLTRDTITVKSLTSWTKKIKDIDNIDTKTEALAAAADQKVIYLRLSQFGDQTNKEWSALAVKLNQQLQNDKNIKGIVFDLRRNPGGYLNDAVNIVEEFVKDGVAVQQENREKERMAYNVRGNGLLTDVPMVVLIDKGSASASEIVAGALQDHKRALLVGETSFGKGTIQQAEDLGDTAGLHVTIAKWLTPNGTWVHQKGLKPDVEVSLKKDQPDRDTQLEKAIEELLKQ